MAQFIYTMNRVGKVVPPKRVILRDISLSFFPGAKIGVLGLNGAGKSTLLRIMAGVDKEFEGEARPQPGIKIGFLPQEPQLDPAKDVRGNVEEAVSHIKDALARLDQVYAAYAEPDADFDKIAAEQAQLEALLAATDGHNLERTLEVAADALRLPPWDADVSRISGGERRRVALCRCCSAKPDMLLLDEPTNHLDAESVRWLEHFLEQYPGTVIAVTHDRYFLDNVAGWILELDRGYGIPWQGNYTSWLEQKEQRLQVEEQQQAALKRMLERELEWVRANPKARQAKSKARMQRFEELSSREFQARNETNEIYIPPGPAARRARGRSEGLSKAYGEKLLFEDLTFKLPQGGIVGIIGPNGAGKTTLFRIIDRPGEAGCGRSSHRTVGADGLCRPVASFARRPEIGLGRDLRRPGHPQGRRLRDAFARLCRTLQLPRRAAATADRRALRRRTQPRASCQGTQVGRQRDPARRAHQRPRRRDAARARGSVAQLSGLRGRDLPRPLVPGPDRDAHPCLRGERAKSVWFEGNYSEYVADLKRRRGEDAEQPHRVRYRSLHG